MLAKVLKFVFLKRRIVSRVLSPTILALGSQAAEKLLIHVRRVTASNTRQWLGPFLHIAVFCLYTTMQNSLLLIWGIEKLPKELEKECICTVHGSTRCPLQEKIFLKGFNKHGDDVSNSDFTWCSGCKRCSFRECLIHFVYRKCISQTQISMLHDTNSNFSNSSDEQQRNTQELVKSQVQGSWAAWWGQQLLLPYHELEMKTLEISIIIFIKQSSKGQSCYVVVLIGT